MICADVDQMHGIIRLTICDREVGDNKFNVFKNELLFPVSTPSIPKEIYNIIPIIDISLCGTKKKLVISNKIINLYNIEYFFVIQSQNVIISREICKLPSIKRFHCGCQRLHFSAEDGHLEDYKRKIMMEITTILN